MGKLHFGYGSNMWFEQMKKRCPDSKKIGIGELKDFKWIISKRGYANIVESEGDYVRGFVFWISKKDEEGDYERRGFDSYEGYYGEGQYNAYTKETHKIKLNGKLQKCMLYIDRERINEGNPEEEYIDRINKGVKDGLNFRVQKAGKKRTKDYVKKYIRKFIPKPS